MDQELPEIPKATFLRSHKVVYFFFFIFLLGIWGYYAMSAPTSNRSRANRQPTIIHIAQGESLSAVASDLENKQVIRHHSILKALLVIFKFDKQIDRGDYRFDESMPVWSVAWMLARSEHHIDPIKITFKEGITNEEIATILSDKLSAFRKDLFLSDVRARQGYLFPDTYFFYPFTTSSEIVSDMSSNFSKHIAPLKTEIESSGHTLGEIVTMASVIEKEAHGKDDAPTISGILWKRIKNGMLLQVDAARETYTTKGLPKEAISNPGFVSIDASLHSVDSPYLFYLHGKDGRVHFATTFAEHKRNISLYLK